MIVRGALGDGQAAQLPERFFGVPLYLTPDAAAQIAELAQQLGTDPLQVRAFFGYFMPPRAQQEIDDGIAVVKVRGSLYRGMFWDDYRDLKAEIEGALNNGTVRGVLLDIDSPGGSVAGCFELSSWIHAQRDRKPIWALANDQATSAAYAIASAASRIIATPQAITGSIGCRMVHVDLSEAYKQAGYKVTEIDSGRHKSDLSSAKPLSKTGRDTLQRIVDACAEQFFAEVATYRPALSVDAIRDLQAAIYVGAEGVEAGLVDEVAMREQALERFRAELDASQSRAAPAPGPSRPRLAAEGDAMDPKATGAADAAATVTTQQQQPAQQQSAATVTPDPAAAAADAFKARAQAIVDLCALAGRPEMSGQLIAEGLSETAVRARLLELRAQADAAQGQIQSALTPAAPTQVHIDRAEIYARWNDPAAFAAGKARAAARR